MSTTGTGNTQYDISQSDLADPTLYRLNQALLSINNRLTTAQASLSTLQQAAAGTVTSVTEEQINDAEWVTVGGTANAITGKTTTVYRKLEVGFCVRLFPLYPNTGPVIFSVNQIVSAPLVKNGISVLAAGDLSAGLAYLIMWDGKLWQIVGTYAVTEAEINNAEYLTVGGTANAITATTATAYLSLAVGFVVRLIPANTNTAAVTINVDSTGVEPVTKNGAVALSGGELVAGQPYFLMWDGAHWRIIGLALPASTLVIGSDASGNPILALVDSGKIIVGNSGSPSVAAQVAMSQDATIDHTGKVTVIGVNAAPVPVSQGIVGTNSSGQIVAGAVAGFSGTVTLAALTALGTQGSITFVNGLATSAVNPT